MCLYGQDLDEDTTPVEAGLTWVIGMLAIHLDVVRYRCLRVSIGKDRREKHGFIGAESVLKHLKDGPPRRRIGLVVEGAPARRKYPRSCSLHRQLLIYDIEGAKIVAPSSGEELGECKNLILMPSPANQFFKAS